MISDLFKGKNVLILGAHPDDELGCGGAIIKLTEGGANVFHYFFSLCEQSLESIGLPNDQLIAECDKSRSILGIPKENTGNYTFPVRYFPQYRQDILETMISLKKIVQPELVLVPNQHDIHQDHHVMYEEAVRAFKHCSLFGYEMPWNTLTMNHDCFVKLEKADLERKIQATEAYKSQMNRNYANIEFFTSLAKVRGVQANVEYAECFEIIRLIV